MPPCLAMNSANFPITEEAGPCGKGNQKDLRAFPALLAAEEGVEGHGR